MKVEIELDPRLVKKLKSDFARLNAKAPKRVDQLIKEAGLVAETKAAETAPFDTGRLRQSIRRKNEPNQVVVYTNVKYAPFQEFGTRFFKGRHYMRKGYLAAVAFMARRIKKMLQ